MRVKETLARHGGMVPRKKKSTVSWEDYARELGLNLQKLRLQRGLSQEKLAHMAGISAYTYQKFEKGESKPGTPMNPRLQTLLALCQVLEVEVWDVLPSVRPLVL